MTTFKTLLECIKTLPPPPDKTKRPYRVTVDKKTFYVVSNSPGNAAQQVCQVETVKQKEQLDAFRSLQAPPLPFTEDKSPEGEKTE